jgi:hypothetical protein
MLVCFVVSFRDPSRSTAHTIHKASSTWHLDIYQHQQTSRLRYLIRTMDRESCGCITMGDGCLYQPVNCGSCAGSMRMYGIIRPFRYRALADPSRDNCCYCQGTGSQWYPCTHRQSLGVQAALSATSQGGSSYARRSSSNGGGSSQGGAAIVSQGT